MKYNNPVIPGFYPDPSICRFNGKYYLVNSSFQYFPGIPLFESEDLINFKQIGHVLTRNSQLKLENCPNSGGIYAPTIRVNNGRFYVVVTNVTNGGNFFVYTDDIYGEWSDPVYVDIDGIDPSLYFEDGHCYFCSNGTDDDGVGGIVMCEIDPLTGKKLSKAKSIWQGTGGRFLEGPHLYKIRGEYYLLAAEGGTEYGHMVVMARGKSVFGPFTAQKNNPVVTNRNLGGYLLQGTGHADIIEDEQGNLFMVMLAFRQLGPWMQYHVLGRETCLVPVDINEDGEVFCGKDGTVRLETETDRIKTKQKPLPVYTFSNARPGREFVYLRNPIKENYKFSKEAFVLKSSGYTHSELKCAPTFTAIRQRSVSGRLEVTLIPEKEGSKACFSVYMDTNNHYDIIYDGKELVKEIHVGGMHFIEEQAPCMGTKAELTVYFGPEFYYYKAVIGPMTVNMGSNPVKYLSSEVAGGFTGVMFALSSIGAKGTKAEFRNFRLESFN